MKTLKARCHFAVPAPRAGHILRPSGEPRPFRSRPETGRPFVLPSRCPQLSPRSSYEFYTRLAKGQRPNTAFSLGSSSKWPKPPHSNTPASFLRKSRPVALKRKEQLSGSRRAPSAAGTDLRAPFPHPLSPPRRRAARSARAVAGHRKSATRVCLPAAARALTKCGLGWSSRARCE